MLPKSIALPPGWSVAAMRYHHMHGQREAWTIKLENPEAATVRGTGATFADAINNAIGQCQNSPKTLQAA